MSQSSQKIALLTNSFPLLWEALERDFSLFVEGDDRDLVRVIIVSAAEGASRHQLAVFPNAELVAVFGVGVDGLDRSYLKTNRIALANTPAVLDNAVAEHALALILSASRDIRNADKFVREQRWNTTVFPLTPGLQGKRCGIVGLGRIGSKVASIVEPLGVEVAYFGRRKQEKVPYQYFDDLIELADRSDILVLAIPGGPKTKGIINEQVLKSLGPKGILVNIARGSVVDETVLIQLLKSGELGFAALDVFAHEPSVPKGLLNLPNVLLTPHIACATYEARKAMVTLTIENLRAYFAGRRIPGWYQL